MTETALVVLLALYLAGIVAALEVWLPSDRPVYWQGLWYLLGAVLWPLVVMGHWMVTVVGVGYLLWCRR
jgi:hypothetical protein